MFRVSSLSVVKRSAKPASSLYQSAPSVSSAAVESRSGFYLHP